MPVLYGTLLQPHAPDRCDVTPSATVRIDDDGRIAEVGPGRAPAGDVVGDGGCWVLPGFVDGYLHMTHWDRRGIDGIPFPIWREQVTYPAELRFRDLAVAEALTGAFVTDIIAGGTTTVAAYGSPFAEATDRSFEVFARRGLRVIFGMMLNDVIGPEDLCQPTDRALDESRTLAARWHNAENGRLRYAFSPRRPMCCSEKLMRGAATLADMVGCYVQTRVAESLDEAAAIRETYPDRIDDVDLLADVGLLRRRTLLAHGVFLSGEQRRQVAEAGTAVVHCPGADLFRESGMMDYHAHRVAGIRIALGSSLASGFDPFMPSVAVQCIQTAKAIKVHGIPRGAYPAPGPAAMWWTLTRGGAEALDLADRVGAIETGFDADCLVVRPEPWIGDLPLEQQVSALLYTLRPQQIEHVFIAGKRVGPGGDRGA